MDTIDPAGTQDPTLPGPKLISPANGSIFDTYPRRTECRWDPVPGAVSYVLEWDYSYNGVWHAEDERTLRGGYATSSTELVSLSWGPARLLACGP
jgi:hypothetical protein